MRATCSPAAGGAKRQASMSVLNYLKSVLLPHLGRRRHKKTFFGDWSQRDQRNGANVMNVDVE
jgi:hypothetical protein